MKRLLGVLLMLVAGCDSGSGEDDLGTVDLARGDRPQFGDEPDLTMGAASCADGVRNQDETDTDCGGGLCPQCDDGKSCVQDSDCAHLECRDLVCERPVPPCMNGMRDGRESDVDCGGGTCAGCGLGMGCAVDSDCKSRVCNLQRCSNPQMLTLNFEAPAAYPVGASPYAVALGDFDLDQRIDAITANPGANNVTLFAGRANGTFAPARALGTDTSPIALATGDFNGDGKPDFAVSCNVNRSLSTFLGKGDGTFLPAALTKLAGNRFAAAMAVGELNGD